MIRDFYIIEHLPDRKGVPSFIPKIWLPELPDIHYATEAPLRENFAEKYKLKANAYQLDGDYLISDDLISSGCYELFNTFSVNFIGIPVDICLLRRKVPGKKYFLFFLSDYLSILDVGTSIFTISRDIYTNKLNTPEDRGLDRVYYEKIEKFRIKENLSNHLFFCIEISKHVCSGEFKDKFESLGFKGVKFIKIDDSYIYDPWAGW